MIGVDKEEKEKALSCLIGARLLLSDAENHCKESAALDSLGDSVTECSDKAVQWCMLGAMHCGQGRSSYNYTAYQVLRNVISENWNIAGVSTFNDVSYRKHEEVLEAFDRAIEALE